MNNQGTIETVVFGCTDAMASSAENIRHKTSCHTQMIRLCMCLIMLLVMAFKPASAIGSSASGKDVATSASMYTLTTSHTGSQAIMGEVYVSLDGNRARIYQRGSGSNAVFALGAIPISTNGTRLDVSITEQNRREARERVAKSLETIVSKITAASAPSLNQTPAAIEGMDSRLGDIQLFLDSALADDMAVSKALDDLDGGTMQPILDQIQDLKKANIAEIVRNSDREADPGRTRDSLRALAAQLLAHENIRNVFIEKEMLGSLLRDMDAVDSEIALCYADGARIAREGSTIRNQSAAIEETAAKLEQLERLSASAAHLEQQYSRFMTMIGFEDASTKTNQAVASAWNAILWESILACFAPEDIRQYEIQSAVCLPLDRLAAHCSLAGDAARALRTLKALDTMAGPAHGKARISLTRVNAAWTCTDRHITLQPVFDSSLRDWRTWEQWVNTIGQRI